MIPDVHSSRDMSQVSLDGYDETFKTVSALVHGIPEVETFWIFGSRAKGTSTDRSDLDLGFLVSKPTDCALVESRLSTSLTCVREFVDFFSNSRFPLWHNEQGREVGVLVVDKRTFASRASASVASLTGYEENSDFAQHKIINSSIVFDSENWLKDLRNSVMVVPASITDAVCRKYLALLAQKLIWWELRPYWKGACHELENTASVIEEIAKVHYALNQRFFMSGLKEYPRDLESLAPDLTDLIPQIGQVQWTNRNPTEKQYLIATAVRRLCKMYFGSARQQQSDERWDYLRRLCAAKA